MKQPKAVAQLIEELEGEAVESHVSTLRTTKAVVYIDDDDDDGFTLTAHHLKLLFASEDTAQRFVDAIDSPSSASICLFDITPEERVLNVLERSFCSIDEG